MRFVLHVLAHRCICCALQEMDADARNELREGCVAAYAGVFVAMKGVKGAMAISESALAVGVAV